MRKYTHIIINLALIGLALPALAANQTGITNPLGATVSVEEFIINIIQFLLGLSALLAFAAIIYGGIRMVASFGSEGSVQTGKKVIQWAVIGLVVIMLSYVIMLTVARFLDVGV